MSRYEAAVVDLQYAWKLPRRSWEQLTACRAAVEKAFEVLPADMQESVEVTSRAWTELRTPKKIEWSLYFARKCVNIDIIYVLHKIVLSTL